MVSEIIKQCRTYRLPIAPYHLRTVDGREVDLLLEREDGFVAIECKQAERLGTADFRHLHRLQELLDKPLLLGIVVSNERVPAQVEETSKFWVSRIDRIDSPELSWLAIASAALFFL